MSPLATKTSALSPKILWQAVSHAAKSPTKKQKSGSELVHKYVNRKPGDIRLLTAVSMQTHISVISNKNVIKEIWP